jgi:hypothetical protein
MLLTVTRQLLVIAKRVQYVKLLGNVPKLLDSLWAILEGCWKADANAPQITLIPTGQMILLAGCDLGNEKTELSSSHWQYCGNFQSFSPKRCISVYIDKKIEATLKKKN